MGTLPSPSTTVGRSNQPTSSLPPAGTMMWDQPGCLGSRGCALGRGTDPGSQLPSPAQPHGTACSPAAPHIAASSPGHMHGNRWEGKPATTPCHNSRTVQKMHLASQSSCRLKLPFICLGPHVGAMYVTPAVLQHRKRVMSFRLSAVLSPELPH